MQEITASGKRKINTGKYESADIMFSLKKQVLDGTDLGPEMKKLYQEIEFLLDQKEKEIRNKIEKKAKKWIVRN